MTRQHKFYLLRKAALYVDMMKAQSGRPYMAWAEVTKVKDWLISIMAEIEQADKEEYEAKRTGEKGIREHLTELTDSEQDMGRTSAL